MHKSALVNCCNSSHSEAGVIRRRNVSVCVIIIKINQNICDKVPSSKYAQQISKKCIIKSDKLNKNFRMSQKMA